MKVKNTLEILVSVLGIVAASTGLAKPDGAGHVWLVDTRADMLEDVLSASCSFSIDDESLLAVTFGVDLSQVQYVLPDSMGPLAFNVNGKVIEGKTGPSGSTTVNGGAGSWVLMVGDNTSVKIVGTDGAIIGGAGGWGKVGGAGGFAVVNSSGAQFAASGATTLVRQGATGRTIIGVPEQLGTLIYDGEEQTVRLSGSGYTTSGTMSSVEAGSYTVSVTPDAGHCWSDGSYGPKNVMWKIVSAKITDGEDEPGPGEILDGGISKYDVTYMYDGEGHTINTQALYAVTLTGSTPSFSFSLDGETGWQSDPFVYTNVGEYVTWYKIAAPGYVEFKHQSKLTISEPPRVVSVTARQRYPWNGLVDIDYELEDAAEGHDWVLTVAATNKMNATGFAVSSISAAGAMLLDGGIVMQGKKGRIVWDAKKDLPQNFKTDELEVTLNVVKLVKYVGVQLWEGGPYWAECNVGATKPEDAGYYFWWGDTVGYKRNAADDGWVSVKDGSLFSFSSENCPTYGKANSALQSAGYIDSTGNLVAAHDAATAHLGTGWRMPTSAELSALDSKCTVIRATRNGVYGRLVKGKDAYSSKSIFLPTSGFGEVSGLNLNLGWDGYGFFWSSTPLSVESTHAWGLYIREGYYGRYDGIRYFGSAVRPVREFAQ